MQPIELQDMPNLCFFGVKTKIDDHIVATFVTENETEDCIEKALQIIKS